MTNCILVSSHQPVATIHLPAGATSVERHAATELQLHLKEISGATLPITDAPPSPGKPAILLGKTAETQRLLPGVDWAALKEDGVIARQVGNRLVLAGATPRGTLYAVYEYLDRVLGCRWYTPTLSVIPKRPTISADGVDIVYTPAFRYREPFFTCAYNADWAARNRVNGSFYPLDDKRGGKFSYAGFVHTFYGLLPPAKYFAQHPEYFSEVDGKRVGTHGQLCLTNSGGLDVVTQTARQWLTDQPGARIISISQNDWVGNCTCANCKAIDDAEGSPAGSLIRFVNAVAERLEGEFPGVLFDTLAYMYTIVPPRNVRPRKNVVIRLCHLNGPCDSHPLEKCQMNAAYLGQLQGWGKIAPEVFIWDYFNDFANYFCPYPNLDAICADLPLYARSGVTGIFCQGDGTPSKGAGDMAQLRAYLIARLLWRPESNGRAIIDEFLDVYYGPAAPPIREYLELLHRPAREGPVHITPYMATADSSKFLPPEALEQAGRLLDAAAKKVARKPVYADRVAAARLPLDYVHATGSLRFGIKGNRYAATDPKALKRARKFFFTAMAHGAEGLREQSGRPIRDELAELDGSPLLTLLANGLVLRVAPRLGARILGLTDPVTGQEWIHLPLPGEPAYPVAGGYEEYSQSGWRSPGWKESFVVDGDRSSLRLSAALAESLVMERTYRLETTPAGPRLVIESSLRNAGYSPTTALLRMHPELEAGDWGSTSLRVRAADGSWRTLETWQKNPAHTSAPGGGSQWLEGDAVPAGAWALVRGERQLIIEFEAGKVAKCLPSWDLPAKVVRLDMYSHSARLEPQEAIRMRQVWTPASI